jgi:hypothetical protein
MLISINDSIGRSMRLNPSFIILHACLVSSRQIEVSESKTCSTHYQKVDRMLAEYIEREGKA